MTILMIKKRDVTHEVKMEDADMRLIRNFSSNSIQIMQGRGKRNPHACIKHDGTVYPLSRLILGLADTGKRVIFLNGDTLDLRRKNMQIVSAGEASRKKLKSAETSSKYMGVHWSSHAQKFRAVIKPTNAKGNMHIGYFTNEEDAARAYDAKSRELFGTRATLNFPNEVPVKKAAAKPKTKPKTIINIKAK